MPKPEVALLEFDAKKYGFWYRGAFQHNDEVLTASTFSGENKIRYGLWNIPRGELIEKFEAPDPGNIYEIILSPSKSRLALRFWERTKILNLSNREILAKFSRPNGSPKSFAWLSDESRFAIGYWELLNVFQDGATEPAHDIKIKGTPKALAFVSAKELVVGADSIIYRWHLGDPKLETIAKLGGGDWNHAATPRSIASANDKGQLVFTDLATAEQQHFAIPKASVDEMRFSPDASKLALGFGNGRIIVWDVAARAELTKLKKASLNSVDTLTFSPDSQRLLVILSGNLFVLDFRPGAVSRPIVEPELTLPKGQLQCLAELGADYRMDQTGIRTPVNPLPEACPACHFPDLDFVPQPYYLAKGIDKQTDLEDAEVGNFLVRARVRKILETLAPGQCRFYPTHRRKTGEETAWFLAVPVNFVETGRVKEKIPRCAKCSEPLHAHGTQYENSYEQTPLTPYDISKSKNWISTGEKPVRDLSPFIDLRHALELSRFLCFSARLLVLFKKLGIRENPYMGHPKLTREEEAWVNEQLTKLEETPATPATQDAESWFKNYLAKQKPNAKKKDIEKLRELSDRIPASYKLFAEKLATKIYKNIDGNDGLNVRIRPPSELDFETFAGRIQDDPDQETGEDGIVFAETEFGDQFCFKRTAAGKFEVYRYDHEIDDLQPYANSFESCLRGWVEK